MGRDGSVAVSAPGKVLLAGGYLVLDRAYTGLVFGLNARIHAIIQPIPTRNGVVLSEIEVRSPQFAGAVWEYGYRWSEHAAGMQVTQLRMAADLNLNRNPFIETALAYVLTYIANSNPGITPASIRILADNDYYSTSAEVLDVSKSGKRFHDFGVPLQQAHKTGLGSSAALVTALTGAVLSYYLPSSTFDLTTERGKKVLHNLAQAAHCAAQGKVGSGFDVASAVYGSCLYRRFSPRILSDPEIDFGKPGFALSLRNLIEENNEADRWDTQILHDAVKVPKGLRLVMCDVSCGSQTPGMVKKVLQWRKENPTEADAIWTDLHAANESLAKELTVIAEKPELGIERLGACFTRIRKGIRAMSEKSGVPIEPPSQTALLDACEAVPGVVGGVVPGAGGYDAISLLIEDDDETVARLKKLLAGWKFQNEQDGDGSGGKVSMLSVSQEMEGVRKEEVESYRDWLD